MFYSIPVQVRFSFVNDDGEEEILYGIAYKDEVICACCGGVFEIEEVTILDDFPWANFALAISK